MKRKLILAVIVLIAGIALTLYLRSDNGNDRSGMLLSGNVEVTEVNLGFTMPGRIQALSADEGQSVAKGAALAALDNAEFTSVVMQTRAAIRNAEVLLNKTKKDLERARALSKSGAISPQQGDAARTAYDAAFSKLQSARATGKAAEVRLNDTVLYAPLSGVVLEKNAEQGEIVAAGRPVVTIGDLEKPWIKVYVKEDKLGRLKLGQRAEVRTDSFPNKIYEGTVVLISSEAEFTPKNVQTAEERVKLVFGVKVNVKNENNELKPGMPADVRIILQ